jgi:twitching motility protein PilI
VVDARSGDEPRGARLFQLLKDMETRCRVRAAGLPQQEVPEDSWEGVLFAVGGRSLVAPLAQVKEILNFPSSVTRVPGTRAWVRGIANVRGNLLPVVDLQTFLFGRASMPGRRSRILVIDHSGVYSGLLVDQMVGIRHFLPSARRDEQPDLPDTLARFVELVYAQDGEVWPVFSVARLAENPEFQLAAA